LRLLELIEDLKPIKVIGDCVYTNQNCEVLGLCKDSRLLTKGDLFFAVKGQHFDGNCFIKDAIDKGASAVVTDTIAIDRLPIPVVIVQDIYKAMAYIADKFYGHPSAQLKVIGITGTNGKTTTATLLEYILSNNGIKTGLIGTIRYSYNSKTLKIPIKERFTTPEAIYWQYLLKKMKNKDIEIVISEVSSHALALKRVDFTEFYLSIFTNLSRDHLDFHGNINNYYKAKMRLFKELTKKAAILNIDDFYGRKLLKSLKGKDLKVITYGMSKDADYRIENVEESLNGLRFNIVTSMYVLKVSSLLIGLPNVYNIASAISASEFLGIDKEIIIEAVKKFPPVTGRFEKMKLDQDFSVVIDYAHTPDALKKVILSLRKLTKGRLITVFGCGGNRDKGKRPEMGSIASKLSDFVIITSDNPRWEDPKIIIKDILKGIERDNFAVLEDRAEAIAKAVKIAKKGDIILLAGKGHEDYQEIAGIKKYFNDKDIVEKVIKNKSEVWFCPDIH